MDSREPSWRGFSGRGGRRITGTANPPNHRPATSIATRMLRWSSVGTPSRLFPMRHT